MLPCRKHKAKNSRDGSSLREQRAERRIPLAPLDPRPSSRYTRKPESLLTAPFVLSGESTAQGGWRTHYTTLLPAFTSKYRFSLFQYHYINFPKQRKSRKELRLFILLGVSRDLDIATFVFSAPRLAFLGPLAIFIVKTALRALV